MPADRVRRAIDRISRGLAGPDPVALGNLGRDLEAVAARLESGEYAETDFVVRSVFEVQRRTREYLTYFAGWHAQGRRWAELLRAAGATTTTEILDLCPGWAPKIELGLVQLGYRGRVTLLDRDPAALAALTGFLELLAPPFVVTPVVADLLSRPPAATAALVTANHVLDDVLLDRWARARGIEPATLYDDEAALRAAWVRVLAELPAIAAEFPPVLAAALASHVSPGGRLVIAEYAGHVEQLLGGSEVRAAFAALFARTREELANLGLVALPIDPVAGASAAIFLRP